MNSVINTMINLFARPTPKLTIYEMMVMVESGVSKRFHCPKCGGNLSLSVTNTGSNFKYNCFRATCDFRGAHNYIPTSSELRTMQNSTFPIIKPKAFRIPRYIKHGINKKACLDYLVRYNALAAYTKGLYTIGYDPTSHRLIYFLIASNEIVGAVGRTLRRDRPKTLIYEGSKVMPFIVGDTDTAVIVEDCTSAAAIAGYAGYTGFSLLGSEFKPDYVPYLKRFKKIKIALDPDAKGKQFKIYDLVKMLVGKENVEQWTIPSDIKDMTKGELDAFIALVQDKA